ncbi:MAG TPA: ammonia-forming cytochrome c nitrite reductase subunit c552 [Candidatus Methanoperedenaceae archaeon]|nr:ammonia-forming cytochrome c nitrite reductase subunit c552 [Candidatus Methanoperedenaceae archaeon]
MPAQAASYVGPERCKQCHEPEYGLWNISAHSRAMAVLIAVNESTNAHCLECHTTGFRSDGTYAFLNVTCEACHGAGSDHVNATPEKLRTKVIKSINSSACAVCHQGEHHPYYEEWKNSSHSKSMELLKSKNESSNVHCQQCHTARGLIETSLGRQLSAAISDPDPVSCQGCHDTHKLGTRLPAKTLCTYCHNSENVGPGHLPLHAQSDMWNTSRHGLAGVACVDCHKYSSHNYTGKGPIKTGHTFMPPTRNPEKCVECHSGAVAPNLTAEEAVQQIGTWQTSTKNFMAEAERELERANQTVQSARPKLDSVKLGKVLDKYNQAKFYLDFVKADKSYGVHNNPKSLDMLSRSKALSLEVIDIVERETAGTGGELVVAVAAVAVIAFALRRRA